MLYYLRRVLRMLYRILVRIKHLLLLREEDGVSKIKSWEKEAPREVSLLEIKY